MELKGNIQVEESGRNVETSESGKQITVTISYLIKGIDISEGLSEPPADVNNEESDRFSEIVDERLDEIRTEIAKNVDGFFKHGWGNYESFPDVVRTPDFVGLHAEVTGGGPQTLEEAKNVEIDLEINAFYDLPVSSLESVIERVKDQIFGKK